MEGAARRSLGTATLAAEGAEGEWFWGESHKFCVESLLEHDMRAFTHYMSTLTDCMDILTGDTRTLMDDMDISTGNRRTLKRGT